MRLNFNILELPLRVFRYFLMRRGSRLSANCRFVRLKVKGRNNSIEISKGVSWVDLARLSIKVHGDGNKIVLGKIGVKGRLYLSIGGRGNDMRLDDGVRVIETVRIEMTKGAVGAAVHIGEGTTLRGVIMRSFDSGSKLTIGRDCMFSYCVLLQNTDEHLIESESGKRNLSNGLSIGDHVWCGIGATVMKNSVIGSGSIVAAKAVVAGRFPEECVVLAGNPAHIAKTGIRWFRSGTNDREVPRDAG